MLIQAGREDPSLPVIAACVEGRQISYEPRGNVRTRYYVYTILVYLRGAIVIRTHHIHKNLYITIFLLIIFGPYYYVPP